MMKEAYQITIICKICERLFEFVIHAETLLWLLLSLINKMSTFSFQMNSQLYIFILKFLSKTHLFLKQSSIPMCCFKC